MSPADSLPRVVLKPRRAMPFFNRHPWVFAGAVARGASDVAPGTEVGVWSHEGEFIARGLANPFSNIQVRLYSWEPETALDAEFWSSRLDEAIQLRKRLFAGKEKRTQTAPACRLVFSEGDGLSGLVVDQYGDWLLMQFTSRALHHRRDVLVDLLRQKTSPAGIWLRTEKGIREAEGLEQQDGLVSGDAPPQPLFVDQSGVRFGVDVVTGQKTGFYFDQRDNRTSVARFCRGRKVLDLFCYSGGFGITAARLGGAGEVLGVDSSAPAIMMAQENARLNEVDDCVRFEQADVHRKLAALAESRTSFDVVITDPPKFARHRKGIPNALKAYARLNAAAIRTVSPGGILAACSCSGLVTREQFHAALSRASTEVGRRVQILEERGQPADHPVSIACPESAYLKCLICRVL